jgi:cytochrome c553
MAKELDDFQCRLVESARSVEIQKRSVAQTDARGILANMVRFMVVAVFCTVFSGVTAAHNFLYSEKCAGCHAADGSGHTTAGTKMTVPDLRSKHIKQMGDDDLYSATAQGKGHKSYPHAFLYTGLKEQQIRDLLRYIRTFSTNQN